MSTKVLESKDLNPKVIELVIEGMTCASCVGRVEKKLHKIEGVQASVNLPLESASVVMPAGTEIHQIIAAVESAGYKARVKRNLHDSVSQDEDATGSSDSKNYVEHDIRETNLKCRLVVSAAFSIPAFLISMIPALHFPHWGWAVAILTLPVAGWAAWPFHKAAAINAKHFASTMDTLISVGVLAAYLFSIVQLILNPQMTAEPGMKDMEAGGLYFEIAAVVTMFLLLGRHLEANAKKKAGDALQTLLSLGVKEANVLIQGKEQKILTTDLLKGAIIVVRPGEKIPTDGIVIEGISAVDASLITGESVPVEVSKGSKVAGATINTSGRLLVEATRVGSETTLAQMGRLVSQAQTGKAPIARLADRISSVFVPIVLAISVITFGVWLLIGGPVITEDELRAAFTAAVSVLVIACPCALGLATPVGLLAGTGRGAQLGILIKGPQVLEDTRTVDTIMLDKTGTITSGKLSVSEVIELSNLSHDEILGAAASIESASEHPIAQAIVNASTFEGEESHYVTMEDFQSSPGGGVKGVIEDKRIIVGRSSWLKENNIDISSDNQSFFDRAEQSGFTSIWVAVNEKVVGIVNLRDTIKPGSVEAIQRLKSLGLRPILLTGDNISVALQVAQETGIDPQDVFAGVTPRGKVEAVHALQRAGAIVAMAGDGVNDAAALAQADLGIAMGSGADVAIEAADLTVMGNDLGQVAQAIELSRKTLSIIKVNLFWAFFYNAVGVPFAALGLLNPMIAGAAMAASSVLVVTNSLRLRKFGN